jgi:ABC-type multidrug transport system fused ATPase/permease subunit
MYIAGNNIIGGLPMEDKIKRGKLMEILENKTTSLRTNIFMMLIMFVLSGVLLYLTQIILDMNLIWSIILSMGTMIVFYLLSQFIIIRIVTGSRES